jgi:hypothetical protein
MTLRELLDKLGIKVLDYGENALDFHIIIYDEDGNKYILDNFLEVAGLNSELNLFVRIEEDKQK